MQPHLYTFKQRHELYHHLTNQLKLTAEEAHATTIALSGGDTQRDFFKFIVQSDLAQDIPWSAFQIYWGDERCVPPEHPESNYGMAFSHLLKMINIPEKNLNRIRGENDPVQEAHRYSGLIQSKITESLNQVPRFAWIILGIGEDGHTASLFPGQAADGLCVVARHPLSGQYRVSMNYELINSAQRVSFVVVGSKKAGMVASVLSGESETQKLPAARIQPFDGEIEWYLDADAASKL